MSDETLSADINRRLESIVRFGRIVAVDCAAGRCRVQSGGLVSAWLPWLERREGTTTDWDPPTVGEGCILLSPSGETAGGIVLVGVASNAHLPPSHDENKHLRRYPDGALEEYDHQAHAWRLSVPDGGSITLTIGATTLTLTGAGASLKSPRIDLN